VLALLLDASVVLHGRTYAYARALGKRCSTCHTTHRPNASNLNARGRWFMRHRSLEGFTAARAAAEEKAPASAVTLGPADPAAPPEAQQGSRIFNGICIHCHGKAGAGTPQARPLNLSGVYGDTPEQIADVVRNGIEGTAMQPFKGALKEDQIMAVSRYVAWLRR
jgi:mono/diheme cytochrome c family protein